MVVEVKKAGRVYMHGETDTPLSKELMLELLEAGYQPYINGKRVTKSSLQPRRPARKKYTEDGQTALF